MNEQQRNSAQEPLPVFAVFAMGAFCCGCGDMLFVAAGARVRCFCGHGRLSTKRRLAPTATKSSAHAHRPAKKHAPAHAQQKEHARAPPERTHRAPTAKENCAAHPQQEKDSQQKRSLPRLSPHSTYSNIRRHPIQIPKGAVSVSSRL